MKHCSELSAERKEAFRSLLATAESKNATFRTLRDSASVRTAWALVVLSAASYCALDAASPLNVAFLWLGAAAMQLVFVASHVAGHAHFLEYDELDRESPRHWHRQPIVFFFAFYHHHRRRTEDNWIPAASADTLAGVHSIVAAHWQSYSPALALLDSWRGVLALAVLQAAALARRNFACFWAGYEFVALLLPYAHGWQHAEARKHLSPVQRLLLSALQRIGVVSDPSTHAKHHTHSWPTIYRDFVSSGVNVLPLQSTVNDSVNKIWGQAFQKALTHEESVQSLNEQLKLPTIACYALCAAFALLALLPK